MNTLDALLIIAIAALIHASFQLSVSVLTLLSSHTIGAKRSHSKLIRLTNSFAFGVAIMTMLLVSFTAYVADGLLGSTNQPLPWVGVCGLLFGLGLAVWLFYYRRERGTTLWIPRAMARYLSDRTSVTTHAAEAFGLGLSSVLGEVLFIIAPVSVAALVLIRLSPNLQIVGILLYTAISLLSLLIVNGLIGSGHRISRIQRWREDNKAFLQFIAGSALLVLGFYVYVDQVLSQTVLAAAGAL